MRMPVPRDKQPIVGWATKLWGWAEDRNAPVKQVLPTFTFRESLPAGTHKAVMVAITWNAESCSLYLNGELIISKPL
jgi:hypothetical protein